MRIDQRQVGEVAILDFSANLLVGEDEDLFRRRIRELAEQGRQDVVLNLQDVSRVDSACIGLMVAAHVSLRNRGGSLRLLSLQRRVHEQLEIAKLDEIFHIYESETDAISGP